MSLPGPIINAAAAVFGGLLGLLLKGKLPERISRNMLRAIGLCILALGLQGALGADDFLLLITCVAFGTLLGEGLDIELGLNRLAQWIESRLKGGSGGFAQGFVTATLLYCVGGMTILGSLESGLTHDHSTLLVKSLLDGIAAVLLGSTLGVGVLFAGIPLLLIQGSIALLANWIAPMLSPELIAAISAVGGVLIAGIGVNMLDVGGAKLRTANMLPALLLPAVYLAIKGVLA